MIPAICEKPRTNDQSEPTAAGDGLPPIGEPPYHFSAEEAELVGRYRFYFTWPALARESGAILAAIGLSALVLSPWLLYRGQLIPGVLVALNVLAVHAEVEGIARARLFAEFLSESAQRGVEIGPHRSVLGPGASYPRDGVVAAPVAGRDGDVCWQRSAVA